MTGFPPLCYVSGNDKSLRTGRVFMVQAGLDVNKRAREAMSVVVMSVPEFARLYRISRRHAYALVQRGVVRAVRLGRSLRVMVPPDWLPNAPQDGAGQSGRPAKKPGA